MSQVYALPFSHFSDSLHFEKYREEEKNETFDEFAHRIGNVLGDDTEHRKKVTALVGEQKWLPAGRIQAAIGAEKSITAHNCYMSGDIDDTFTDGEESIMARATQAAETLRRGGGIGYNFSTIRPNHSLIKKLQSYASGPVSFMEIYDSVCKQVKSADHRRGAQMAVLSVEHPDILEFINAKTNGTELTHFNLSVAITDRFMKAVKNKEMFELRFENKVHSVVYAPDLWEKIMTNTWDWAEPGVIFASKSGSNSASAGSALVLPGWRT